MQKGFFQQQALRVLQQEKYALLLATVLAAVPHMDWLALALMSLVTLRQGAKAGAKLFAPVMFVQVLVAVLSVPVSTAVMMSILHVLPCYLAAYFLKTTSSWRVVSGVLLGLTVIGVIILQGFSPELITQQYVHLEAALQSMASSQMNTLDFFEKQGISSLVLANYLLGVQAASLAFSAIVPLLFARSVQSQLFYPGGFRSEMLNFRGDKTGSMILILLLVLAYFEHFLAINCLPVVLFYFILSGLSFVAYVFSNMRPLALVLLLVLPMIFLSWVVLPLYALLGVLDSLFNFRLYLSPKTGQAT
ncbi:MAG: hypothetical protein P1U61_03960 [Legionellaceae bacterium]|nr:hypothetical protein [Legionellaceae bacterium]